MVPGLAVAVAVFVFVLVVAVLAKIYNQLVSLRNLCDNGFAQIDVQLKRRYDLIPNLVECVKGYLQHERETLDSVIQARNQAANGLAQASQDFSNPELLKSFMGAENALAGALGRLNVVMEAYPDLKANETVETLTEELRSTENKVAFARQAYNDWVTGFNVYRESFPAVLFANAFGFSEARVLFEVEAQDADAVLEPPVVSLT